MPLSDRLSSVVLLFTIGFLSLSLENLGAQVVFLYHAHSSQALALSLSFFLCGLAVGNWLVHRYNGFFLLRRAQVLAGIILLVGLTSGPLLSGFEALQVLAVSLKGVLPSFVSPHLFAFISTSFIYMFLPALPMGVLFPLIADHSLRAQRESSLSVGWLNSLEIFGAVLGSLAVGFVFVPWVGLAASFWCLTAVCALTMIGLAVKGTRLQRSAAVILTAVALWPAFRPALKDPLLAAGSSIVFQKPSPYGTVTVVSRAGSRGDDKTLFINHRGMCNSLGARSERALAQLAMRDWHPEDRAVLNIGLGCGFTADEVLKSQSSAQLDIVEINKVVAEASSVYFRRENDGVLENPRTSLILADGFAHLQSSVKTYDRILIDIEEPTIIHSSAFYTQEGFRLARAKLSPRGVLGLWCFKQKETAKVILNTLRSVFKHARVFPVDGQLVFLASDEPLLFRDEEGEAMADEIEAVPLTEVATVAANPYPKYFHLKDIFNFPQGSSDPFELR